MGRKIFKNRLPFKVYRLLLFKLLNPLPLMSPLLKSATVWALGRFATVSYTHLIGYRLYLPVLAGGEVVAVQGVASNLIVPDPNGFRDLQHPALVIGASAKVYHDGKCLYDHLG